jgi:hypothetical protein
MSKAKRYYDLIFVKPEGYLPGIGSHRYGLFFQAKNPHGGKSVAIIQLNGSITGPNGQGSNWNIDPTIGKVLTWCYENEDYPFEYVHCLNLFSYIDPHPTNLSDFNLNILNHPDNDAWIIEACEEVDNIIVAYGDCEGINPEVALNRVIEVLSLLENKHLYRVGDPTQSGNPQHGRRWNKKPTMQLHRSPTISVT